MPAPSRKAKTKKVGKQKARRARKVQARRSPPARKPAARRGSRGKAAKSRKRAGRASRHPQAKRSAVRVSIGPWAVLNVPAGDFRQVSMTSGHVLLVSVRQQLRSRLAELGYKLVLRRDDTGALMITRVLSATRKGLAVTQGWRVDPAYRLADREHHPKRLTIVEAPNLPPKTIYIVNRLQ